MSSRSFPQRRHGDVIAMFDVTTNTVQFHFVREAVIEGDVRFERALRRSVALARYYKRRGHKIATYPN